MAADHEQEDRVSQADPEELPSADINVETHVHFGMTGSFPLRIAELFFTETGLYIAEYSYITPLFGLGTRKHRKDANAMEVLFERFGIDAVLLHADRVIWLSYESISQLVIYSGGKYGRPKVTVFEGDGQSYAYRLLGERDFDGLTEEISNRGQDHAFDVVVKNALGFNPQRNIRRFFDRE